MQDNRIKAIYNIFQGKSTQGKVTLNNYLMHSQLRGEYKGCVTFPSMSPGLIQHRSYFYFMILNFQVRESAWLWSLPGRHLPLQRPSHTAILTLTSSAYAPMAKASRSTRAIWPPSLATSRLCCTARWRKHAPGLWTWSWSTLTFFRLSWNCSQNVRNIERMASSI